MAILRLSPLLPIINPPNTPKSEVDPPQIHQKSRNSLVDNKFHRWIHRHRKLPIGVHQSNFWRLQKIPSRQFKNSYCVYQFS
ncbi:hypothetical protein NQ315_012491 [Exocentrus adspersus]|uniref:Uncharacterized protein n=1 Tax=Exocentrus adspersus TaxID=1586481 RepID=A0AAV8VBB3_9CUCU|nr:hypothetical protein NQ315_012491 [Exocentrus adspersus]